MSLRQLLRHKLLLAQACFHLFSLTRTLPLLSCGIIVFFSSLLIAIHSLETAMLELELRLTTASAAALFSCLIFKSSSAFAYHSV